jgi:hypothetical protein
MTGDPETPVPAAPPAGTGPSALPVASLSHGSATARPLPGSPPTLGGGRAFHAPGGGDATSTVPSPGMSPDAAVRLEWGTALLGLVAGKRRRRRGMAGWRPLDRASRPRGAA